MRRTTALLSAGALVLAGALIASPASAEPGDLTLDKNTVTVGSDVTATLADCEGFEFGGIALFAPGVDIDDEEAEPIAEAEEVEINDDGEMVGSFTVPADASAGDATVVAFCAAEDSEDAEGNSDIATLKLVAAETPAAETPTADPATPVVQKPTFTG